MIISLVSQAAVELLRVMELSKKVVVYGLRGPLVANVGVVSPLYLSRASVQGVYGQKMMCDVIMESGLIEEDVVILVILLEQV